MIIQEEKKEEERLAPVKPPPQDDNNEEKDDEVTFEQSNRAKKSWCFIILLFVACFSSIAPYGNTLLITEIEYLDSSRTDRIFNIDFFDVEDTEEDEEVQTAAE